MSRKPLARSFFLALAFGVAAQLPSLALAQSVTVDQFRPAETAEDGFAISQPDDRGHLRAGAALALDYALNPLVYERVRGDGSTELLSVVEHQLAAHLGLSFALWDRLVLYTGLPVNLAMSGASMVPAPFDSADGTGLGDLWVGARGRLFGERDEAFALGLQLTATLPTALWAASGQSYSGERGATLHPEVLGEVRFGDGWDLAFNLGARVRVTDEARLVSVPVSHEFTYGVGLVMPFWTDAEGRSVTGHVEAYGAFTLDAFGQRAVSPFEAIVGVRGQPICGLQLGLAGGTGLSRGYGTPDVRGVFSVGWSDAQCPASAEAEGGPVAAVVGEGDADGDGIGDSRDACPTQPEDRDGFEDENGCPDADNDRDTLIDPNDRCPLAPGRVEDGGCPRTVQFDVARGSILALQNVEFATDQDVILERSFPVLQDVYNILNANPQLERVRIEGHTDDRSDDAHNLDLSRRRAASVMRWLIEHGVSAGRVEAWGCGELYPVRENSTDAGRQANRRVEFQILRPAPTAANPAAQRPMCIPAQ